MTFLLACLISLRLHGNDLDLMVNHGYSKLGSEDCTLISANERLPIAVLLLSSMLWGGSWWPLKTLADLGVSGVSQIFVAYSAGALLMLPVFLLQFPRWRSEARYIGLIFVLGGYANLAFTGSLIYGEVVRCMVLFYLLPVWGVFGGRIFLGEQIDRQRALAVVLALTGAFLVLGGPKVLAAPPSLIDLVALSSGFAFAMNNLCFRASQGVPVPSKVAAMFLGCVAFSGALIAVGFQSLPRGVSGTTWLLVAGFGVFWLLTGTAASQWAVTHLEAGRASIIMIMELITAVFTAAWWAGESMEPIEWLGGFLILSATVLEAWRPPAIQASS